MFELHDLRSRAKPCLRPVVELLESRLLLTKAPTVSWSFGHPDSPHPVVSSHVSILGNGSPKAPPAAGVDLVNYVKLSLTGLATRKGKTTQFVTLKVANKTTATIPGPLIVWFEGLPASVTINGLSRQTLFGSSYVVLPTAGLGGKQSRLFSLTFHNPSGAVIKPPKLHAYSQIIASNLLDPNALHAAGINTLSTEGQSLVSAGVLSFMDSANPTPSAGEYSATIVWGDGSPNSEGSVIADPSVPGRFFVVGDHNYTEDGQVGFGVQVTGPGGIQAVGFGQATVIDAPILSTASTLPSFTFGVAANNLQTATFSDLGDGPVSDFSATIQWGDGSSSDGRIAELSPTNVGIPNKIFSVTGDHIYTGAGPFSVTTSIKDVGGSASTAVTTATIGVSLNTYTLTSTEGGVESKIATLYGVNPALKAGDLKVTIQWGDGSPLAKTPNNEIFVATTGTPGNFDIFGSHHFSPRGLYQVTISIAGVLPFGKVLADHTVVIVEDAPLTLVAPNDFSSQTVFGGAPVSSAITTFFDPDPKSSPSDYRISIDWGDGTPVTIDNKVQDISIVGQNGKTYRILGDGHVYVNVNATYNATITVLDLRGSPDLMASLVSQSFVVTVKHAV